MIDQPPKTSNKPEMLIAAVLHLMSHYSTQNALNKDQSVYVKLAAVIERHLTILSELPDLAPVIRATCSQLSEQWTVVVERTMPQQSETGLLARWRSSSQLN